MRRLQARFLPQAGQAWSLLNTALEVLAIDTPFPAKFFFEKMPGNVFLISGNIFEYVKLYFFSKFQNFLKFKILQNLILIMIYVNL